MWLTSIETESHPSVTMSCPTNSPIRRCPIVFTTQPRERADGRTATTISVSQLTLDISLLGKVLADITERRPRCTWESETARDSTLPPPKIGDVLGWLP
jgi:hypothetical protein